MTGFAARIRRATMVEHREAETRTFITRLASGTVPIAGFAQLTAQYLHIYRVLEQAAERWRDDDVAGPFADPALARVPALEADLAQLYGPGWESEIAQLDATRRYTDHLREHCSTSRPHFIAHHYVRYLGDLSGGQMIGRTLSGVYGLEQAGTMFYRFEAIPDARAYKTGYRERLDALPFSEAELETAVAEAQLAFRLNGGIFHEMGLIFPEDRTPAAA
ncbi:MULTISPECIES: biliverdin-producing heme oxygenase [Actinoplanes]|uniref:biliverdin-producing heme oxygenase n=1 Tax=Actinoplanes TaxID=1865 RepID=UPI0005F2C9F6|nr:MULTISPECIES: biliverdin-producing heme oxygenase [Actinoplanes]GLY05092.1 heme oxygenase [Actinoplanes sp. NBRC 101535]